MLGPGLGNLKFTLQGKNSLEVSVFYQIIALGLCAQGGKGFEVSF